MTSSNPDIEVETIFLADSALPLIIEHDNPQQIGKLSNFKYGPKNLYSLNFHLSLMVNDDGVGHFQPENELCITHPFSGNIPSDRVCTENEGPYALTKIDLNIKCSDHPNFCASYFSNLPNTNVQISVSAGIVILQDLAITAVYLKSSL